MKWEAVSDKGVFLGYDLHGKGWHVLVDDRTQISADGVFLEDDMPAAADTAASGRTAAAWGVRGSCCCTGSRGEMTGSAGYPV